MSDIELKKQLNFCGENVVLGKHILIRSPELVSISDNVIIDDFSYLSGRVELGKYVHIASGCALQGSRDGIFIQNFSGLSAGCKAFAVSSDYLGNQIDLPTIPKSMINSEKIIFGKVIIEEFVMVGANSVILPNTVLPIGSTYGAFSKVSGKKSKPWHFHFNGKPMIERDKESILKQSKNILKT